MRIKRWFKLDNAAKLYPAVSNARWSSVFRLSAELNRPVAPVILQRAADLTLPRFPSFRACIRPGLFWYYFEEISQRLLVTEDTGHPCMPFHSRKNHGYLLRIFYYQCRISVEFFHSVTDGHGGLVFLKTLTTEYLRLCGQGEVCFDHGALSLREQPCREETEDAFLSLDWPPVRKPRRESAAYHLPGTPELPHTLHLIAASLPSGKLLQLSRNAGVSFTEYVVSAILWVCYQQQKQQPEKRPLPLRVSVPVNLRPFYGKKTLRNFSSFINPGIDPRLGDYTFPDICREVHAFMRYQRSPKLLGAAIAANVSDEKNLAMRLAPLFLKNIVISTVYRLAGDRQVTATCSNLGRVDLPTGMARHIRRFEFHLGTPSAPLCNIGLLTTGDEVRLMFSSNIRETTLPRELLSFFLQQGVPVEVQSNREEET